MIRAIVQSLFCTVAAYFLLVAAQKLTGWTFLVNDPSAISTFLSSLAQFAAIPVTIAFGVIVLIIQQQAAVYTGRAGALVVNNPGFLFVVALLFEVPAFCILLQGVLDIGGQNASLATRQLAAGAVGPVALNFIALAVFARVWFERVSPAEFSGFMLRRAFEGAERGDRNTVSLAVRGMGESLKNLAASTDYASLHLTANHLGYFLNWYIEKQKPKLLKNNPRFFEYQFPEKHTDFLWIEKEVCTSVGDATDDLLGRLGPAESILYLVDALRPFGGAAIRMGDIEALKVLAHTFVEMGTTERTFGVSINFNTRPLERSTEGAIWSHQNGYTEAEEILVAVFFILFAYVDIHVHRVGSQNFTSTIHEAEAKKLKAAGVDFHSAAQRSRDLFDGFWIVRFQNPDAEQKKALKRIQSL